MEICLDIISSTGVDLIEPFEGIVREIEVGGRGAVTRGRACNRNKVNANFNRRRQRKNTTYLRTLLHLIIIFEFVVYYHGDSCMVVNLEHDRRWIYLY